MRLVFISLIVFVLTGYQPASAQLSVYNDPYWISRVDSTLRLIYNFQFDEARAKTKIIEDHFGNHPAVLLLKAEIVFWKYRPLQKGTQPYNDYMGLLNQVIESTGQMFPDDKFEMEKNFYLMSGYSLLAEQYAEDKDYWSVLSNAKEAYKFMKNGMGHEETIPDYYFTTGLYNYYRVEYPILHPFYKPFLWLFMDGDKNLGIEDLKKASQLALFLKEQANIYLFHIYLRYENDPAKCLPYAKLLAKSFPQNLHFLALYGEALYYNHDFTDLKHCADELADKPNKFYSIPGYLFKGLLAEHNNEPEEAIKYFNFCISQATQNDGEYDHYTAMAYAGLARVAYRQKKLDEAINYYKLASKTEPYVPVKEEADTFLSQHGQ